MMDLLLIQSLRLFYSNSLDLHQGAAGQILHGEGCAGGLVLGEILSINSIHGGKVSNVSQQNGGLDHVVEGGAGFGLDDDTLLVKKGLLAGLDEELNKFIEDLLND